MPPKRSRLEMEIESTLESTFYSSSQISRPQISVGFSAYQQKRLGFAHGTARKHSSRGRRIKQVRIAARGGTEGNDREINSSDEKPFERQSAPYTAHDSLCRSKTPEIVTDTMNGDETLGAKNVSMVNSCSPDDTVSQTRATRTRRSLLPSEKVSVQKTVCPASASKRGIVAYKGKYEISDSEDEATSPQERSSLARSPVNVIEIPCAGQKASKVSTQLRESASNDLRSAKLSYDGTDDVAIPSNEYENAHGESEAGARLARPLRLKHVLVSMKKRNVKGRTTPNSAKKTQFTGDKPTSETGSRFTDFWDVPSDGDLKHETRKKAKTSPKVFDLSTNVVDELGCDWLQDMAKMALKFSDTV